MKDTVSLLWSYRGEFLQGLVMTMKLCLFIWPIGLVCGTLLGIASSRWKRTVGSAARAASFVLAGIPVLVLLFWLHYPLQALLHVVVDPFYTAVGALALVNTIAVADGVRTVLDDFPRQYVLAALVCGMLARQTVLRIELPLIFRQLLPSLLVTQVTILQATLFASLISVDEIFRIAQRINSAIYQPVAIYSALALLFLAVCLPLHGLAGFLRRRYTRDLSER